MSFLDKNVNRRQAFGLGLCGVAGMASLGLFGCGPSEAPAPAKDSGSAADGGAKDIDAAAYDKFIKSGPVAKNVDGTWAQKIKKAGKIRIAGTRTATLFALLNEKDNVIRGFDAGLYQLLTRYILGDETKVEFTQATSDTRESLLQNDQVDAVFATYSITDERKKIVSFAGPYYTTRQGILVMADTKDIKGLDDLAGKNVAAQSGSTGPKILDQEAPDAVVQEFKTDEEARQALEQGRVDAYVIDETLQMSSVVQNPGKYHLLSETFGPEDAYGIGLPHESDGVDFVNEWLQGIEEDGTWAKLWQLTIGDRIGVDEAPEPPALEA